MRTKRIGVEKKERTFKKKGDDSETSEISLPETKSDPAEDLESYSMLCYGDKKIGKTTLTAQFPNALHLMCEPGAKSLVVYQRPVTRWVEMQKYISLLKKDKFFNPVVIDTADRAYEMCFEWSCKDMGIDHPGDENDFGKSWKRIRSEFSKQINSLMSYKTVYFLSHSREEESTTRAGRKFSRVQPSMTGQAREVLEAVVDLWIYYGYEKDRRVLVFRGDEYIAAGIRPTDHFLYTDGSQIKSIDVEGSAEYAYKKFLDAFNNRLVRQSEKSGVVLKLPRKGVSK